MAYYPPSLESAPFTCPHCQTFAHFLEFTALLQDVGGRIRHEINIDAKFKRCSHCGDGVLWARGSLLYPLAKRGPAPNPDTPDDVRADYVEAQTVAAHSTRGAAALLRLAIDKLTAGLYPDQAKLMLNDRIGWMVKQEHIDHDIQQMLDAGRIIGNNAVHPGELDLQATPELVDSLFWVTNELVEELISKPKRRKAIYESIPQSNRQAIERRDGKVTS